MYIISIHMFRLTTLLTLSRPLLCPLCRGPCVCATLPHVPVRPPNLIPFCPFSQALSGTGTRPTSHPSALLTLLCPLTPLLPTSPLTPSPPSTPPHPTPRPPSDPLLPPLSHAHCPLSLPQAWSRTGTRRTSDWVSTPRRTVSSPPTAASTTTCTASPSG